MAVIHPFRALRYDPARVCPRDVLTQPYDKITPAMQDRYYQASPHNLVRIILGKRERGDDAQHNVYTRAAQHLAQWRAQGVLRADPEPAMYVYGQGFAVPGEAGRTVERRGFIALGRLEDYSASVVFRHEQTLSAPKADRLELLRATRAHCESIFMLYRDPERRLDSLLAPTAPAETEVEDEYGVQHRLWRIADPALLAQARQWMADKQLIIADGHHRYETALAYRNQQPAQPGASHEWMMMAFFNMEAEGLVILPTHRVVAGLNGFSAGEMVRRARSFFSVEDVTLRFDRQHPAELLRGDAHGGTAILGITRRQQFLFRAAAEARHPALEAFSPRQAQLDVVRLHQVLLEDALGIAPEEVREQKRLEYVRDAGEATARALEGGADAAFLMNPVRLEQMREVAFAGEVMPQKSTDFYPKLLSGLTLYALQ